MLITCQCQASVFYTFLNLLKYLEFSLHGFLGILPCFVLKPLRCVLEITLSITACADPEEGGGGQGVRPTPLNNKKIGFLSNTGQAPLKNHKATNPGFNVEPSSARQRNAIWMAFRWRADEDSNGVSLAGRWRPSFGAIWTIPPLIKLKKRKTKRHWLVDGLWCQTHFFKLF